MRQPHAHYPMQQSKIFSINDNLRAVVNRADDNPRAVIIHFQARERSESVCFDIVTSASIISSMWEMPGLNGGYWASLGQLQEPNRYAISLDKEFLDAPFVVGLEIDVENNPVDAIAKISIWDRVDGDLSMIYIECSL